MIPDKFLQHGILIAKGMLDCTQPYLINTEEDDEMLEACEMSREAELNTVRTREEAIRTVKESIPELTINFKPFSDAEVRETIIKI